MKGKLIPAAVIKLLWEKFTMKVKKPVPRSRSVEAWYRLESRLHHSAPGKFLRAIWRTTEMISDGLASGPQRVAKTNWITCKTGTKRCQWPAKRSQTCVQWSQSQFVYIVCYGLLYEGRVIQKYSLKQLLVVYRHSRCDVFERYFLLNVIYLNNNLFLYTFLKILHLIEKN